MTDEIRSNRTYSGNVTFSGQVFLPSSTVTGSQFTDDTTQRLPTGKAVHRYNLSHGQANGSDVVSETKLLRICRGAGTLKSFEVRPTTAPTGGDKQFTVDIQKAADASGSWTSMINPVVTMSSADSDNTLEAATIKTDGSEDTADGNAIRIVITASGSTGSQGQGFVATAEYEEQSA